MDKGRASPWKEISGGLVCRVARTEPGWWFPLACCTDTSVFLLSDVVLTHTQKEDVWFSFSTPWLDKGQGCVLNRECGRGRPENTPAME